jgi:cyclase
MAFSLVQKRLLYREGIPSTPIPARGGRQLRHGSKQLLADVLKHLCLLVVLFSGAQASASVQQIGQNLYAYISENDSSSNSTFLVSSDGVLVVDTGLNTAEGGKLAAEIRKISSAPVRWIVNTHYHQDHLGGNSVVGPNAIIISTAYTRQRSSQDLQQNTVIVPVRGEIRLIVGGHDVRIYQPGPAHTLGDLVVYFPDQHAIATGDLFLTNSCPAMDDGDMENWIVALDQILTLPVDHVVPGHFELATTKELKQFHDYLFALRDQVSGMYRDGLSLEQVKQRVSLPQFKAFRQYPKYEATFADNAGTYYRQLERRGGSRRTGH